MVIIVFIGTYLIDIMILSQKYFKNVFFYVINYDLLFIIY